MKIDFTEYKNEMNIVREVMTDEQTQALCGVLIKLVVTNLFGFDPDPVDCKSEKDNTIAFDAGDERSVA